MVKLFTYPNHQKGMTLVVALVTLVVLMLLGIGAMVVSGNSFKLAGNLQFENEAKNRAENAIAVVEATLPTSTDGSDTGLPTTANYYYAAGTTLDPVNAWPSSASAVSGTQEVVIQKLNNLPVGPGTDPNCIGKVNLYRIVAKGMAPRGTARYIEVVRQIPVSACN